MSELTTIPSAETDSWNLAEGEVEGRPTVIRYRPGLSELLGHPSYPLRLTIAWEFGDNGDSGMPDSDAVEALESFEDRLMAVLDPDRLALLAFVYTSRGAREWHFYLSDVQEAGDRINEALHDQPGLPIDLEAAEDPNWDLFRALLAGVTSDE